MVNFFFYNPSMLMLMLLPKCFTLKASGLNEGSLKIAQTLPFDILAEIFFHTLKSSAPLNSTSITHDAESLSSGKKHLIDPTEPPLLLSRICKSWRTPALNIPNLWDGVYLPITYLQQPRPLKLEPRDEGEAELSHWTDALDDRSIELVEWWKGNFGLSSSSSTARSPSFFIRGKEQVPGVNSPDPALPALEQFFATRFFRSAKRLELDILDKTILKALRYNPSESQQESSSLSPLHFPNLRELRIHKLTYKRDYGQPVSTFPPSPSLRELHVLQQNSEVFFGEILYKPFLPFSQLTHVSLSSPIIHDSWRVLLKMCVHLVSAAVNLSGRYDDGGIGKQNRTVVPTVCQLAVSCKQLYDPTPFFEFSFTNLTSLRIISTDLNPFKSLKGIELFLRATPNLRELHFDFCLSFEDFLFIPFDNPPPAYAESRLSALVPNLELLVVDYVDPGDKNVGRNIIRFLYSHWLCSGWEPHSQEDRNLEFHIMSESYFTSKRCSDHIIHELEKHLLDSPGHPIFDMVSVHRAKHGEQRFEVFDLEMTRGGWDEALSFRYPSSDYQVNFDHR